MASVATPAAPGKELTLRAIHPRRDALKGYTFRAEFNDGTTAKVTAAQLQTFPSFQRAVLTQTGKLYRNSLAEYRGVGASQWRELVERMLRRG